MIHVEGILNSRPLTLLSSDADNFDVLTPGHFLIGRPITSISEPNLIDVNENRLSQWEKITKVVQRTWKKWKSDYLNTLQARSKWITEKNDLMIGQMVLIRGFLTYVKDSFCRDFVSLDGCTCQLFFESGKRDIGKIAN
ncbi:DUF5641 domain-containing protein [Trichonephila clavipes]|nr:DUF5641 domain-containing protein [Trichonephila clavipes]